MRYVMVFILTMVLKLNGNQEAICSTYYCDIIGASSNFSVSTKNDKMLEVKFVNSSLKTFPNQLLEAYPELRKCDISNSMVQHLDIKRNNKLEWLDASRNQIRELSVETLKNISQIVSLFLSRNRITDLKENLFDDLKNLEVLDLSHNQITFLDVEAFFNLTSLKSLYLNHNNMTEFYLNVSKAYDLIEIYGGHNQIKDYVIFLQFGYKGVLDFDHNQIIDFISIGDVDELKLDGNRLSSIILKGKAPKVSVNSNQIESIEISPRAELEVLLIRDNLLTDIRNITEIVSIQVLDISSNPIQSIEEHSFDKMTNLIHLSLRNTGLLIPSIFLSTQRKLTYLDISGNHINRFDFGSFKNLINLQTLMIENCSMERIENYEDQKQVLSSLKSISVDGNKFQCSFAKEFINVCLKNGVKIMTDALSPVKKSSHIMGISCNGIDELDEEDKMKYQWEDHDQPAMVQRFNDKLQNLSIEVEMEKQVKVVIEKSFYYENFCFILLTFTGVTVVVALTVLISCCRRPRLVFPDSVINIDDEPNHYELII